jgi:hypothetical protein
MELKSNPILLFFDNNHYMAILSKDKDLPVFYTMPYLKLVHGLKLGLNFINYY